MRNAGTFALSLWQDCRREIFAWNSHICSPPAWLVAFLLLSGTLSFALPQVGNVHCSTSGLYTFRAQGGTSGGAWSEPGVAALRIQILPPWWGTWWFRGLSAAICLTLLWAGYRIRVGTLHERHRVLEREQQILRRHEREISALNERLMKAHEEERMRIAGDLHDGVLQQLEVTRYPSIELSSKWWVARFGPITE